MNDKENLQSSLIDEFEVPISNKSNKLIKNKRYRLLLLFILLLLLQSRSGMRIYLKYSIILGIIL